MVRTVVMTKNTHGVLRPQIFLVIQYKNGRLTSTPPALQPWTTNWLFLSFMDGKYQMVGRQPYSRKGRGGTAVVQVVVVMYGTVWMYRTTTQAR